ncbi:hypothetical protein M422DRAFT_68559 [Sphaerobolus stellatus SS14]|uniref:Unplaced genomic scaffold SPHSTscaffold_70, whole genome shotgun sequence n=1 Tax=Sphaerobolus stellatus (strain SS14) TaxID=990650 RepID=A0A0C9VPW5_SPHS4|nr:hypothetical protein M422DRAFT_68559 [Sphaerobolus stellatus SS14]
MGLPRDDQRFPWAFSPYLSLRLSFESVIPVYNTADFMETDIPQTNPSLLATVSPSDNYRNPPYWHEDGDIILIAQDTQGKEYRFRVHRFILCFHSPVFRDMHALGVQTIKAEETPTVPLKDDSVEDVCALLLVLYKGLYYSELYANPESLTFDDALGVLRLAHKYQMDQLGLSVVKLLQLSWPLNYGEYKQVIASLSVTEKRKRIYKSVKLMNAARLTECHDLLLPAVFEIANSISDDLSGSIDGLELSSEDWRRITKGRASWLRRLKTLESAGIFKEPQAFLWDNSLPAENKLSIFETRNNFSEGTPKCTNLKGTIPFCVSVFSTIKELVGRAVLDGISIPDACGTWTVQKFKPSVGGCDGCSKWMVSVIQNKGDELWENVPEDFDFPKVDPKEYKKTHSQYLL